MRASIRSILLSILSLALVACANDAPTAAPPSASEPPPPAAGPDTDLKAHADLRYDCTTDAQCTVKDIGNCCGHYPACLNVDSPTDPDGVARECAERGLAGICGYPVIASCVCRAGRCEAASSGQGDSLR